MTSLIRLLCCPSNVEDLVVDDNTSMTEVERRLSIHLFHVLALTCRGKALQVVKRVPEKFGFEASTHRLHSFRHTRRQAKSLGTEPSHRPSVPFLWLIYQAMGPSERHGLGRSDEVNISASGTGGGSKSNDCQMAAWR